jgi:hypothetical protein
MKEIYFTFDAFGEWLEHYGIKMWWMMKGRGKLRPKLGQPASHHIPLSPFSWRAYGHMA